VKWSLDLESERENSQKRRDVFRPDGRFLVAGSNRSSEQMLDFAGTLRECVLHKRETVNESNSHTLSHP